MEQFLRDEEIKPSMDYQEIAIRWHLQFWNHDQDTLNEPPMHEFVMLEQLTGEEACERASKLIGRTDEFAPMAMGDGEPYPNPRPIGAVRQMPTYPPTPRPYTAHIKYYHLLCPYDLGAFETQELAEKALLQECADVEIISIEEFDEKAYQF